MDSDLAKQYSEVVVAATELGAGLAGKWRDSEMARRMSGNATRPMS